LQSDLKKLARFERSYSWAIDRQGKEPIRPDFSFLYGSTDPTDGHCKLDAKAGGVILAGQVDCIRWQSRNLP